MSREDPQLRIRLPIELKEKIEETAKANNRSMNAEIV
ncbi:Arc family DNA-binding protein, partial [Citrobacter freundii]